MLDYRCGAIFFQKNPPQRDGSATTVPFQVARCRRLPGHPGPHAGVALFPARANCRCGDLFTDGNTGHHCQCTLPDGHQNACRGQPCVASRLIVEDGSTFDDDVTAGQALLQVDSDSCKLCFGVGVLIKTDSGEQVDCDRCHGTGSVS